MIRSGKKKPLFNLKIFNLKNTQKRPFVLKRKKKKYNHFNMINIFFPFVKKGTVLILIDNHIAYKNKTISLIILCCIFVY